MRGLEELTAKTRELESELTELKRRETVLRKLASAVEHSPISVMITDCNGAIEYVNPKFCQVTGYLPHEVVGRNPRILKGEGHPEQFYRDLWETILSGQEWHGQFHNRNKDGSLVWELASISPVRDDSGVISHFVGVKEDITELKSLQLKLGQMAHFDELTALPNRALFMDRLEQIMVHAKRYRGRFALLFVDLDGFKEVNDHLGHQAGDQLLQAAAHRFNSCVRGSDTVARVGGDEFIILLNDIGSQEEPGLVSRKLLANFQEPFSIGAATCKIGISIGISVYPDHGDEAQRLILAADLAMYEAKRGGKNNFRYAPRG